MAAVGCIEWAVGSPRCRELAMARYKCVDTNPQFLSVDLARQLRPGTFEHAVNHLLDHEIDRAHVDARFRNDATGTTAPHFATIAHVVSTLRDDIAQVFAAVLAVCDGQGLIGREMIAIDGVKLPSNA